MHRIIVDDEQAKGITESIEGVEIFDRHGKRLGYVVHGFANEDITLAQQRLASDEPRYTTQHVLEHLRTLEQK